MSERSLLIRGGTAVNPSGAFPADLLVRGETIAALGSPGAFDREGADETLDARGKYVLPGLVDPHIHLNSPFMGTVTVHDFESGSRAAAFGGVTSIIDFTTQPKGGSIIADIAKKDEEAKRSYLDYSMSGILLDASPETLAELPGLVADGIPTYKCFTTYKHSGRLMDDESMLAILEATAKCGGMLMVHCENDAIIAHLLSRELAAGHFVPIYHARTRPNAAEAVAIRRVVELMRIVPAPVYLVHVSAAESLPVIEEAKREGLPLRAETCTHYLALTEDRLEGPDGQLYVCSPPLRKEKDVEALWKAVVSGLLEVVSSDDAGVPPEDNLRIGAGRFDKVPSGMTGIEPRLAVMYTEGVAKGRISLPRMVELLASGPARIFGMSPRKGLLAPGSDADVLVFDPEPEWTMTAKGLHQNTSFCPFEGMRMKGRVESVLSRGEFVIKAGELVGRPGRGKRIARKI